MSAYSPASSAGWLDLDAAASERVSTLLRALEEPGTLDPLGLGTVRDTFSAMLSPGTSTVQTRLRYFIFLPWIFRSLEEQRVAPGDFARRLRDSEARLIDQLRHLGPDQGVIGYSAGRDLKRMPSEVYWGGLRAWGLSRYELSLGEYAQRAAGFGRSRPDRDDDGNATTLARSMWVAMPSAPDEFHDGEVTFELTSSEAQLLTDHIRRHHPRSLLAALCADPGLAADADLPWDVPLAQLPEHLGAVLHHARCFSELMIGPQHLYNVLLARKAAREFGWDTSATEESETTRLDTWADLVEKRHKDLATWADDIAGFWHFLPAGSSITERTRRFIENVVARAVDDSRGFPEDTTLHALIRDREMQLKGKRARLTHRSALEGWNQAPFGGQLNYRWPITRSYMADMARAGGGGAEAGA